LVIICVKSRDHNGNVRYDSVLNPTSCTNKLDRLLFHNIFTLTTDELHDNHQT